MNKAVLPPLVAVVGPTASGKSALAIALAEQFGGEIVNTDSMQVYRFFDIGTAKPTGEERDRVPHHLIDVANPEQGYSAGQYVIEAKACILDIHQRGKLPILCGGTGLYFRALMQGIAAIPAVPEAVHQEVAQWLEEHGLAAGYAELMRVDAAAAEGIHPHDPSRIARALAVFRATGVPLSSYRAQQPFRETAPRSLSVGYQFDRPVLYERINRRVREMIAQGWIEEVRGLLERGYGPQHQPMRAIGYKQIVDYLQRGNTPEKDQIPELTALTESIATSTRRYAKRQLTWFRKHPGIGWSAPGAWDGVCDRVKYFLKNSLGDR